MTKKVKKTKTIKVEFKVNTRINGKYYKIGDEEEFKTIEGFEKLVKVIK